MSLLSLYILAFMPKLVYASPKSLYVIADLNAPSVPGIPIETYDIQPAPTYLVYQDVQHVPNLGGGAVGIAIDSQSQTLFITSEFTNIVLLINATTFENLGNTTAPGANDLAGIVYDHDKGLVYTVDRNTGNLYVYQWNPVTQVLTLQTQVDLTAHSSDAYGIALNEIDDILYVADGWNMDFDYYDTATWTHLGTKTTPHYVVGIAVDAKNGFVYTTGGWFQKGVFKYNLATDTETFAFNGTTYAYVLGVAVDPDKNPSPVYVTTHGYSSTGYGDVLMVLDSDLNELYKTGDLGNPTGIGIPTGEVSYNPLGLSKSDGLASDQCIPPGDAITYTITYNNLLNDFPVNNVVLNDTLPPETEFVSASDGGTYDSSTHKVTWDIGTLPAGEPQHSVTLVTKVKLDTPGGTTLDNSVKIDSDETPETTQHEYTNVCTGPFTIESCNSAGAKKDSFDLSETVYVNGSGYSPSTTYDIYVVNDVSWSDGMTIPGRVSDTAPTVTSGPLGHIPITNVWNPSLTIGKYDIVVDVNGNGVYDAGIDALDDNDVVTGGFLVIPEYWLGTILGLVGCFAAFGVFRISKRKRL